MIKENFDYILNSIANISALPIRLYENNKMINYYSIISFPIDPISLYEEEILKINQNIYCYHAPHFFFYGLVNVKNYKIIIGPVCISLRESNIKDLSYDLNLSLSSYEQFSNAIKMTTSMPFTTFLQMILLINFVLNGEKKDLSSFYEFKIPEEKVEDYPTFSIEKYHYNSYEIEKQLLNIVESGNVEALKVFAKNIATVRAGTIGKTPISNIKNLFIVTATLVARSAIKAGVDIEDALSTSDALIIKLDLLNSIDEVTNLYVECITSFTNKVALYKGNNDSPLANKLTTYILENISKNITIKDVCAYLYMSKSNLCLKLKKEVGLSVNEFINTKKIKISENLLKDRNKTIVWIAEYLGFSSHSHFTRMFKKIKGISPHTYRLNYLLQK